MDGGDGDRRAYPAEGTPRYAHSTITGGDGDRMYPLYPPALAGVPEP